MAHKAGRTIATLKSAGPTFVSKIFNAAQKSFHADIGSRGPSANLLPATKCDRCKLTSECLAVMNPKQASVIYGLEPLLRFMTYQGLLHFRPRSGGLLSPTTVYAALISIITWLNFFRFFYVYIEDFSFGSRLFVTVVLHVWFGQLAFVTTIYHLKISPALPAFLDHWIAVVKQHDCRIGVHLRRMTIRCMIIMLILVLTFTGIAVAVLILEEHPDSDSVQATFMAPLYHKTTPSIFLRIIYMIFNVYFVQLWFTPTILIVVICMGLQKNFKGIVHQIQTYVHAVQGDDSSFEKCRKRHQRLCHVVKRADAMFSLYNLVVYITCIVLICFIVYNILFSEKMSRSIILIIMLGHMILSVAQMCLLTAGGSSITKQATAPIESLYDLDLGPGTVAGRKRAVQISVFLNRVSHGHIGLTAWHLFNINKSTFFTLTTMVLSYVLILIKFGLTLEYPAKNKGNESMALDIILLKNTTPG